MTEATQRRGWAPRIAATALVAATAFLVGCYHPHHVRHASRDGWYGYEHRDRSYRKERRHERRHRRHHHGHYHGCGH